MYAYLNGILKIKTPTSIILDVNGVGFQINISLQTFEKLPDTENNVVIYTVLIHREDTMQIYGFINEEEKAMFELLISISGIGPKIAQGILSGINTTKLRELILSNNVLGLTNIPGIGRKTAERIIIELKDKISKLNLGEYKFDSKESRVQEEAFLALVTLGYQRQLADKAIRSVMSELKPEERTVENLLKKALSYINQ